MFRVMPQSEGNFLAVEATGKLTHQDYEEFLLPKLEALFSTHGRINLLCHLGPEFEGWDIHGAWDDTLVGIRHRSDFERLAIVGGPAWIAALVRFGGFLMKGQVRLFESAQLDAALKWAKGEGGADINPASGGIGPVQEARKKG